MQSLLDRITIESPCSMEWGTMTKVDDTGADRVRHCGSCRLNVFNISAMPRAEAEELLASRFATGQRVCAQFIRRKDGTIVTADCITARNRLRARARRVRVAAAALMAMILPGFAVGCGVGGDAAPTPPDPLVDGPVDVPSDPEQCPIRGDVLVGEAVVGKLSAPEPKPDAPETAPLTPAGR